MAYAFAAITGATSGIGAAFARALPPQTNLLLSGRDAAKLAAAKAALAQGGRRVETVAADLASEAGRRYFLAAATALPIELLVNNAGLGRFGRVIDNPAESEREMVEVNVVAVVTLTRALLPQMLERAAARGSRAGLIIVGSTASFQPTPYLATYGATKTFDLFYAEALAGELSQLPIDVLALCPGGTETAFFTRRHARLAARVCCTRAGRARGTCSPRTQERACGGRLEPPRRHARPTLAARDRGAHGGTADAPALRGVRRRTQKVGT